MEDYIRVTAKTVEDAILEASIQLGTSSDNVEYTVIERETKGFLGIGAKKAVIEARKKKTDEDIINEVFGSRKETAPKKTFKKPVKEERSEKLVKEGKKTSEEAQKPEKEIKKDGKKEVKKGQREGREAVRELSKENKEMTKPSRNLSRETKEMTKTSKDVSRETRDITKTPKECLKEETETSVRERTDLERETKEISRQESVVKTPKTPADPKEVEQRAEEFLKNLFATMDMQVEIHAEFSEDTLNVDISGEDMGVLIGKRGQTLDSIQYLVSLVVNKGKSSYVRVKLDTENYRNRRKATLENLAKNIAFKVKKTRRPVYLEPMNPYERRIIHSALQNDPYVTTHSEGEEPCRKVVVTLKKRERNGYHNNRERLPREQREERENKEVKEVQEVTEIFQQDFSEQEEKLREF